MGVMNRLNRMTSVSDLYKVGQPFREPGPWWLGRTLAGSCSRAREY